jgi:Flp pilus assembly protein TadG
MRNNPRRGAILVVFAIMLVALLSFLAFVFDLSRMYAQKNELQTSADAASLAGAIVLSTDTTTRTVADSAISIGERNEILKKTISLFRADVQCGIWDDAAAVYSPSAACGRPGVNAVAVTTRDSANYVFPVLIGATGKQLTSSAIAWAAFVGSARCVKPIGIPYALLTKTLDPTNTDILRALNAYDLQQLNTLSRNQLRFELKISSPAQAGLPGNTGALNLPLDNGANDYRRNLATCYAGLIGIDTVVSLKTGSMPTPTISGLKGFCDPLTPDPSLPNGLDGQCQDGNGNMGKLMVSPLWYAQSCQGGSCNVIVKGLVSFKLDTVTTQAAIIGHFVSVPVGGTVSSTPSTVRRIVLVK